MSGLSLSVKCQEQKYRAVEIAFASIRKNKKPLTVDSPECVSGDDGGRRVQWGRCFSSLLAMSTLTREQFFWRWWVCISKGVMAGPRVSIWWFNLWKSRACNINIHLETTRLGYTKDREDISPIVLTGTAHFEIYAGSLCYFLEPSFLA